MLIPPRPPGGTWYTHCPRCGEMMFEPSLPAVLTELEWHTRTFCTWRLGRKARIRKAPGS